MSKNLYIQINGGLGKNLSFIRVAQYLKRHNIFDKIYVSSPYWDAFKAAPAIDDVYKPNEIRDFIFDARYDSETRETKLVIDNMYQTQDFIFKTINYQNAWMELVGVTDYDNEELTQEKIELDVLTAFPSLKGNINQIRQPLKKFKDYAIMQFNGGQSPLVQVPTVDGKPDWSKVPYNYDNEPLKRHYPKEKVQKFVDLYSEKYPERAIIMYQLPNEPLPDNKNVIVATLPYLAYYELAKNAAEIVCIDSSLQHLTAGLTRTAVLWAHSRPESFGYSFNQNITQRCKTSDILYFTQLGPSGARVDYIEPEDLLKCIELVKIQPPKNEPKAE